MADDETLIAIHPDDFVGLQGMYRAFQTSTWPQAGVPSKKRRITYDFIRVMIIDADYPVYTPREERAVAYFVRDLSRETITIEMFGDELAGDLNVTIDGTLYRVNCQSSTAQLRTAFGFNLRKCRVTAFPGLWEFAFSGAAPTITAEPAIGTTDILTFSGGVVVTEEAWVSVGDDVGRLLTINVVDVIPFAEGEVKPGSVAVAMWASDIGWLVRQWHCREFQFYPLAPEQGGGDGSGVGDVVDGGGGPPVVEEPSDPPPP